MQRSLAVAALVVLVGGLGAVGYWQVAGEAVEPVPEPVVSVASSPSPRPPRPPSPRPAPEPIAAPTRAPRPDPTPSPTPAPSPSPSDRWPIEPVPVEPPAGDTYTEDEYRAIYEEHQARSSQFATAPDFNPDDLGLFFTPECQCWEDYYQYLLELHAADRHGAGPPPVVLSFRLLDVEADGSFVARVIDQQQGVSQLLSRDGTMVEEFPPSAPFESEVTVTPTSEGWRTSGLIFITEQSS